MPGLGQNSHSQWACISRPHYFTDRKSKAGICYFFELGYAGVILLPGARKHAEWWSVLCVVCAQGKAQRRINAVHVLDALVLNGTDVREQHFNQRSVIALILQHLRAYMSFLIYWKFIHLSKSIRAYYQNRCMVFPPVDRL